MLRSYRRSKERSRSDHSIAVIGESDAEESHRICERFEPFRHLAEPFADPHFSFARNERTDIVYHQPPDAVARHAGEHHSDQATQRRPDPIDLPRSRRMDHRGEVGAILRKNIVERTRQPATAAAARQIGTYDPAALTREFFRQEVEIPTLP